VIAYPQIKMTECRAGVKILADDWSNGVATNIALGRGSQLTRYLSGKQEGDFVRHTVTHMPLGEGYDRSSSLSGNRYRSAAEWEQQVSANDWWPSGCCDSVIFLRAIRKLLAFVELEFQPESALARIPERRT